MLPSFDCLVGGHRSKPPVAMYLPSFDWSIVITCDDITKEKKLRIMHAKRARR